MQLGNTIVLNGVPDLGLGPLNVTLPEATKTRIVVVFKVPFDVSEDGYYISINDLNAPIAYPPCNVTEIEDLIKYVLFPDGTYELLYLRKGVL